MNHTVFISHSNPEDNYFASWLASKLKLFGYKVWVDTKDLLTGDSFWPEIEEQIRKEANRFIAVVSESYINKARIPRSGIQKEIRCAQTRKDVKNFILPIRIDISDFDDFSIDLLEFNATDFSKNWGTGLKDLVNDMQKLNVPRFEPDLNALQFWFEAMSINTTLLEREERYFSNWFEIEIPSKLFVHQPEFYDKEEIAGLSFPYISISDRIISFFTPETAMKKLQLRTSYEYEIAELLNQKDFKVDDKFALFNPKRTIVQLINKSFTAYLESRGLKKYQQSNRKEIFYFDSTEENAGMISLKRYGKTRRAVFGYQNAVNWHFAISHNMSFYPNPLLKIKYHLVFTTESGVILGQDDQHVLRRSVPSDWYNRKWFETLLALIVKIGNDPEDKLLQIPVDELITLKINIQPKEFISSVGYYEPIDDSTAKISE